VVATVVAIHSVWRVWNDRLGWRAVATSLLVAMAMLETTWLSFGFHLLSWKLIY
jgi:hypothetical protein